MANMKAIARGFAAGVICLFAASTSATQVDKKGEQLLFRVLVNNKQIGFHSFKVTAEAQRQTVDINADFDITFLAIPVYSYEHNSREILMAI